MDGNMKLVVENPAGEPIDFEVLPGDTFNDLQSRLFQNENLVLDLAKLEIPDKPLTMSTNVMKYYEGEFSQKTKLEPTVRKNNPMAAEQPFSQESQVELARLQVISPLKITPKDDINFKELEELELLDAENVKTTRQNETESRLSDQEVTPSKVQPENIKFPENLLLEPMPRCRLCAEEIFEEDLTYLYEENSEDGMTVADKINACLPVIVSLKDKLPKQICSSCFVNLESSYDFANHVSTAEEKLIGLLMISKAENMSCPLCCEGFMETIPVEDSACEDSKREESDEITEYVQSSSQNHSTLHSALRRKRRIESEDPDWEQEDELDPPKKQKTTEKKGMPKGAKNKILKTKGVLNCYICFSQLRDMEDALQHTLSAHCDTLNLTYPCPLCQDFSSSEKELTEHVDKHFEKFRKKMLQLTVIQCFLCVKQHQEPSEMYRHVQESHLKNNAEPRFSCSWCESEPMDVDSLVDHIISTHVQHNSMICPICTAALGTKGELQEHLKSSHLEQCKAVFACTECHVTLDSEEALVRHMVEQHCTTVMHELPMHYSCAVCGNNFRSQYQLSKHTCNTSVFLQTEDCMSGFSLADLVCPKCGKKFPTKARFVFHIFNHNAGDSEMRCDECFSVFTNEDTFYDHVRFQHEPDNPIKCEICQKVFKNEASLACHMRRHQDPRNHECNECGKKFQNAQTLREHRVGHMQVKPYQCHICGAYLSRLSRLRVHLRFHSVKDSKASMQVFKCNICSQVFPSMNLAMEHIQKIHAELQDMSLEQQEASMVFRCEFCDGCFLTMGDLNTHRAAQHPDPDSANAYTCSVCGATFSTYARVTTHKLSHGINTESLILNSDGSDKEDVFVIPQYFLCSKCDKKSLHYTYLKIHGRFQHGAGKRVFTCHTCNEKFTTPWSLQFHVKKQHGVTENESSTDLSEHLVYCPHCEKPYKSETRLESHIRRFHTSSDTQDDGTSFMCDTCGKTFTYKSMLEAHMDAHKGMKRFPCNRCEKRFTHRAGLLRHMKLHADVDAFVCEFCSKKFRDKTERDNHCRAHTGERPFMCDVCGRFFHTKAVLLDHSRIHSDVRPYQCDVCGQSFRRANTLKNHYLIHTGERPYKCTECKKSFRLRQTLSSHVKKEHGPSNESNRLKSGVVVIDEDSLLIDSLDDDFQEAEQINMINIIPREDHESSWSNGTFACTECDETFQLKLTLLAHMRKEHPRVQIEDDSDEISSGNDVKGLLSQPKKTSLKQTDALVNRKVFSPRKPVVKATRAVPTATEIQPGFSLLLK